MAKVVRNTADRETMFSAIIHATETAKKSACMDGMGRLLQMVNTVPNVSGLIIFSQWIDGINGTAFTL